MPELTEREYQRLLAIEKDHKDAKTWIKRITIGFCAVVVCILAAIVAAKIINPSLNLRRSNIEKQAVIKEQEAISEAEVFAAEKRVIAARAEAEARLIEAQAIADSQELIASTLTPEYLQWRFYEVLATTENQIIYVPTDGSLPITEANRMPQSIDIEAAAP